MRQFGSLYSQVRERLKAVFAKVAVVHMLLFYVVETVAYFAESYTTKH